MTHRCPQCGGSGTTDITAIFVFLTREYRRLYGQTPDDVREAWMRARVEELRI